MSGSVDSGRESCPAPGLYRHYKGAHYRVLGCVRHSESEERLVLYRALYGERGLWVRPLAMFTASVDVAGEPVPRFALVRGEAEPSDREHGIADGGIVGEDVAEGSTEGGPDGERIADEGADDDEEAGDQELSAQEKTARQKDGDPPSGRDRE